MIGALVWRHTDGKYLLLQRSATKDVGAGQWECVTGRLEQGESFEQAVRRETFEELGLEVRIECILGTTHFYRGEALNEMVGVHYGCSLPDGTRIRLSDEHCAFQWVTAESSPMISNLFLHQVLDEWLVKDVQPRRKGQCFLTRCADDFIMGFELEADACRVRDGLPKRVDRFRLTIHPEKTGLMAFKRPLEQSTKGQGTFDFLGCTHYWAKTRRGYWVIKCQTVRKRLRRFMKAIWTWCRENRHEPVQEPYRT